MRCTKIKTKRSDTNLRLSGVKMRLSSINIRVLDINTNGLGHQDKTFGPQNLGLDIWPRIYDSWPLVERGCVIPFVKPELFADPMRNGDTALLTKGEQQSFEQACHFMRLKRMQLKSQRDDI